MTTGDLPAETPRLSPPPAPPPAAPPPQREASPQGDRPDAADLAAMVAAHGMLGTTWKWPVEPFGDVSFRSLVARCATDRITGYLLGAIDCGAFPANPGQQQWAREAHVDAMCASLRLETFLLDVAGLLDSAAIGYRVIKGPASAHLDHARPELRGFGDVDLLLRGDQWDRGMAVLAEAGFTREMKEPRPGFDRRFGKGATLRSPDRTELDVHRTFVMGPLGLAIQTADLWEHRDTFALAGRKLPALDAECRLLLACYNVTLSESRPKLAHLRDVAQLVLHSGAHADRTRELAKRWKGEGVLAEALRSTWTTLRLADATSLSEWGRRYVETDPWVNKALATYRSGEHTSYATKAWASLGVIPRVRDRLAFGMALVFPTDGHLGGERRPLPERMAAALRGRRGWKGTP